MQPRNIRISPRPSPVNTPKVLPSASKSQTSIPVNTLLQGNNPENSRTAPSQESKVSVHRDRLRPREPDDRTSFVSESWTTIDLRDQYAIHHTIRIFFRDLLHHAIENNVGLVWKDLRVDRYLGFSDPKFKAFHWVLYRSGGSIPLCNVREIGKEPQVQAVIAAYILSCGTDEENVEMQKYMKFVWPLLFLRHLEEACDYWVCLRSLQQRDFSRVMNWAKNVEPGMGWKERQPVYSDYRPSLYDYKVSKSTGRNRQLERPESGQSWRRTHGVSHSVFSSSRN